MSNEGLAATVELLGKVLALESRQGYRNRAATGGLHRFFEQHFARHDYDETTWSYVERILGGLRRYEKLGSEGERHAQLQIVLRDGTALGGLLRAGAQQARVAAPAAPAEVHRAGT